MKTHIDKLLIFVVVLFIAIGCARNEPVHEHSSPQTQTENHTVSLKEEQIQAAGIVLGAIEKREVFEKVKANGYFEAPPQNRAQVSAFYAGYVKKTSLLVGDVVKKGQIIATLENPEYIKLQQNFMEVNGQLNYLKSEYERKKVLQKENIASTKNLLKAEADYQTAFARHTGLKKELQMMGFNIDAVLAGRYSSHLPIRTPIDGTVTAVNMVIGKYVGPEEILLEVVDTDHLHIELNVFEKDVLKVKEGQVIHLTIPSLGDQIHKGEVYLVGKSFDQEKRTVNIHGHIDDEENNFIPGTYIEADILVEGTVIDALPQAAVVTASEKDYIFLEVEQAGGNHIYQRVAVDTGLKSEGWVEVKPFDRQLAGKKVVIEGAYFLSSALEEKSHDH